MSPIPGTSAMSPYSPLPCRGGGDGICRNEQQWLRKHHTPPLYFRQAPNVPSLCCSESGTALQSPQPSLWVQETEISSGLPFPPSLNLHGTSQPLCRLFKVRSCPKRRMEAPCWLLSKQFPTHLCDQGLSLLPMEAK